VTRAAYDGNRVSNARADTNLVDLRARHGRPQDPGSGEPRLPTFLIIGAPKTGTTSLHRYLAAHPEIFMAETKELNFFIEEFNWSLGTEWYMHHFAAAGEATAVGEASPRYTQHPYHLGVAERVAAVLPVARLVYVVRNPLEQMLSHHRDRLRWASEREPADKALLKNPIYLETAKYGSQAERFLACFPPERFHVVISEELRHPETRLATLAKILRFLEVDDTWVSDAFSREHNVGLARRRWLFQRLAAQPGWGALANATPEWLKRPVRPIIHRGTSPESELSDAVARELKSRLSEDIAGLREIVGPEFDGWGIA
jgi:hypothetical protein